MPSQVAASSDRQQLLLTALRQADRELSGQDLHALLRQGSQPMGLATVYRHLRQLQQRGLIRCRHLPSGEALFAPLDRDEHHLTCVDCGSTQRLEHWAKVAPDRIWLAARENGAWRTITYAQALATTRRIAAALIARGYAEMLRFGEALGAEVETLSGLCGLGDLVLTCSSTSSRNFALGKALGEGMSAAEALADKDVTKRVTDGFSEIAHTSPEAFGEILREDFAKYARIVKDAGIKPE